MFDVVYFSEKNEVKYYYEFMITHLNNFKFITMSETFL